MSKPKQTGTDTHCFVAGRKFSKMVTQSDFISVRVPNMMLRPREFVSNFFEHYAEYDDDVTNFDLNGDYESPEAIDKLRARFHKDLTDYLSTVMVTLMRNSVHSFGAMDVERVGWPLGTTKNVNLGYAVSLSNFLNNFGLSVTEGNLEIVEEDSDTDEPWISMGYKVTFVMPAEIAQTTKSVIMDYLNDHKARIDDWNLIPAPYREVIQLTGWQDMSYQLFEECSHSKRTRQTALVVNDRVVGVYKCDDCLAEFTADIPSLD